jgi:hypothetical protein
VRITGCLWYAVFQAIYLHTGVYSYGASGVNTDTPGPYVHENVVGTVGKKGYSEILCSNTGDALKYSP